MSTLLQSVKGIPVAPSQARFKPVSLNDVTIDEGFWKDYQDLNHEVTLAHIDKWLERTGWLKNFELVVSGNIAQERKGREFSDSEIYKYLEALSWEYGRTGDPALNERIEAIARTLEAAQDEDGYLNTRFGHPGLEPRYSDFEWGHELYCFGHLIQAAVARLRTFGEDRLTAVARRVADHVCETFGPDGLDAICGHAEIEVALAEFGRATGEQKYIEQARLFIDRHGKQSLADIEFSRAYFQDDVPVREADSMRGHAVRAMYLSAGALDVAHESNDQGLAAAVRNQWDRALARRTYVTGGMGSHHQDEAFGEDFELPSDRAYSETCAGIGSIMVAWRLLLADGQAQEADHIERVLFNVLATALADSGDAFFYTNSLHQRVRGHEAHPDEISPRAHASLRAPWFEVSCCPTNISRTIASLGAYVATTSQNALQIHQYPSGSLDTRVGESGRAQVRVRSEFPRRGRLRIEVGAESRGVWDLQLRVPGWAADARVTVNGDSWAVTSGYVTLTEASAPGTIIDVDFGSQPRILEPDPRIDAVRGCVAVQVGPQVYCVESVDLPDDLDVDVLTFTRDVRWEDGLLVGDFLVSVPEDSAWPYSADSSGATPRKISIPLRPYNSWGNRGPATMRVWLPVL